MSLTKEKIIANLYAADNLPKEKCVQIFESMFQIIKDELQNGRAVMISGFGRWSVKKKKSRIGRNPQTGEPMEISARKVVNFKSSLKLKRQIL